MTNGGLHSIEIDGVTYTWDRARDLMLMNGMPVTALLVESTLAGMMWGIERMVGLERFALAMQAAGRRSVDDEWRTFISQMPSPEDGLRILGGLTPLGGLGRWEVVRFDHAERTAVFRVTSGFEPIYQQVLGVAWGSSFLAGKFAGYCSHAFGTHCWAEQSLHVVRGDPCDEFVVRPSSQRVEDRLDALLDAANANAADLAAALERLRREVDERRRVEEELRGKLAVIERQAADIQAMSAPILQVGAGVLAVPIVGRLDRERARRMTEALLAALVDRRARAAILDLTGAEDIDEAALDHLLQLGRAVALLGARCLISGLSPAAAQLAADLGVDLRGLAAHATLESALAAALRGMSSKTGRMGHVL